MTISELIDELRRLPPNTPIEEIMGYQQASLRQFDNLSKRAIFRLTHDMVHTSARGPASGIFHDTNSVHGQPR